MEKAMRDVKKRLMRNCEGCGVIRKGLKKCGRCKVARYCSRECQSSHWKAHKKECKSLENKFKAISPFIVKTFKTFQKSLVVRAPKMLEFQGHRTGVHVTDLREWQTAAASHAFVSKFYTRAMVEQKVAAGCTSWNKAIMALDHAKISYPRECQTVTGGLVGFEGDLLFATSVGLRHGS